jgi:N utilization substance protein B
MIRTDPAARRRAREAALQMLYQREVGRISVDEAIDSYWPSRDPDGEPSEELRTFADGLVRGTVGRMDEIDALIASRAHNWRLERMAVIDRIVLRLGVFELLRDPATPARVVINEALELARTFSGDESVAFVNGVLDAVRKELGRE